MVVKRGTNDHGILEMAERFRGTGVILRFIEYMDVGATNGWQLDEVVPSAEIVRRSTTRWPLEPVEPDYRGEVAARYRYRDGGGEIGLISSVTQPFCHDCTRARLSAEGKLYTCLFASRGHDLRALVRGESLRRRARRAAARALARPRRPLLGAAHAGHPTRPAQGRDVAHRRLGRRRTRLAGARDEQVHADVLAARPLADARRELVRTLLERHGGGTDALARRVASAMERGEGAPGPWTEGTRSRGISEIVFMM